MRNHDIVSNGFLALTTASFVLLCSSLLAVAFGWTAPAPIAALVLAKMRPANGRRSKSSWVLPAR